MYEATILSNDVKFDSFKVAVDFIDRYGIGKKPPSYHEVKVFPLKKEVVNMNVILKNHRKEWAKVGCTVMIDGWTNKNHQSIINFFVNCAKGSMF